MTTLTEINIRTQDFPPPPRGLRDTLRIMETWAEIGDDDSQHIHWEILCAEPRYGYDNPSTPVNRRLTVMEHFPAKDDDLRGGCDHRHPWENCIIKVMCEVRADSRPDSEGWVVEFHTGGGGKYESQGIEEYESPGIAINRAIGWMRARQSEALRSAIAHQRRDWARAEKKDADERLIRQAVRNFQDLPVSPAILIT